MTMREQTETPHDGFFARQIRVNFRILIRMIGFERARATVAEIINSEAERKADVSERA